MLEEEVLIMQQAIITRGELAKNNREKLRDTYSIQSRTFSLNIWIMLELLLLT